MRRKIVIGLVQLAWRLYARAEALAYVKENDNDLDDQAFELLDLIINSLE